jgi:nicotinamidase-related amidase
MDLEPYLKAFAADDLAVMAAAGYGQPMGFGQRPALMVVDATWAFCGDRPEPVLEAIARWPNACGLPAWQAIAVIAPLLAAFRRRAWPVIYTVGQWRADRWDMGSWLWKHGGSQQEAQGQRHYDRDPNEVVTALRPAPEDLVVAKQKPSGFFGTPLQSHLTLLGCDSLVVTGGTTSGCVRATVVDAFSANYKVALVADGCFDRSATSHAVSLVDMSAKYADIVSAAEVLQWLDASEPDARSAAGPLRPD